MTFDSPELRGNAFRRMRYAVAASLLLHLLLFWPAASPLLNRDPPAALHATVRQAQPPPAAIAPVPPQSPTTAVVRARSEVAEVAAPAPDSAARFTTPAPMPAIPALEPSKPVSVPHTVEPATKSPPARAGLPPVVAASAPASPLGGSLLTPANASGEAVDGLRGYRLAVASQARRFKRYPAQALASGWEGSADVRLEVGGDGRAQAATLSRSSGHDLLDRAALAMIDAGAERARVPESLRGRAFAIVLPVVFNLGEE
jgi:protein TonB